MHLVKALEQNNLAMEHVSLQYDSRQNHNLKILIGRKKSNQITLIIKEQIWNI